MVTIRYGWAGILWTGTVALWLMAGRFTAVRADPIQASGDTATQITREGDRFIIEGETLSADDRNLFHSLRRFGLSQGEIADFIAQPGVQNILTRVVGGNASVIDGTLRVSGSNANLFLMNPAGVIFGSQARLDVPADFTATTATGIGLGGGWFSAVGSNEYGALVGEPHRFVFGVAEPGAIVNAGQLTARGNLMLLGGTVINTGRISAPGDIVIAAVPGEHRVRIEQPGNLLSLTIDPIDFGFDLSDPPANSLQSSPSPNAWILPIATLPELLTGGNLSHVTQLTVTPEGDVVLSGSTTPIPTASGSVFVTNTVDATNVAPGQDGGTIQVLGDRLSFSRADLDASGSRYGGTVIIGGDVNRPGRLPLATDVQIDRETRIRADSLVDGDGGRIDLAATRNPADGVGNAASAASIEFRGTATARGGAEQGNGGVIQSNQPVIVLPDQLDVGAANGNSGQQFGFTIEDQEFTVQIFTNAIPNSAFSSLFPATESLEAGTFIVTSIIPTVVTSAGVDANGRAPALNPLDEESPDPSADAIETTYASSLAPGYGDEQPETFQTDSVLSGCYGRYAQTLRNKEKSAFSVEDIVWLNRLGAQCYALGYYPQALALYQRLGDIADRLDNAELKSVALGGMGNIWFARGEYQQALERYQQQWSVTQTVAHPVLQATAAANLGNVYLVFRDYEQAIAYHQQALNLARANELIPLEIASLGSLGILSLSTSDFAAALDYQQQALDLSRTHQELQGEVNALINTGGIYFAQSRYSEAIATYQQALVGLENTGNRALEASVAGNLGGVYGLLGQFDSATDALQQQLAMARDIGDRQQEANALGSLGIVANATHNYERAIEYLEQYLFIVRDIGDRQGVAYALAHLGESYYFQGRYDLAQTQYEAAETLFQSIQNRQGAAAVTAHLGQVAAAQDQPESAFSLYMQALNLQRVLGDRDGERQTLGHLGELLANQGEAALAIVFYKQAINLSEAIRQDLRSLPVELQQSYATEVVAETYRALADLLLRQDRVLEAQQVLDLLKVQELDDYLQDVRGHDQTMTGLDYYEPEQRLIDLYDQAIALGQELAQLRAIAGSDRTDAQQQRLAELVALEQEIVVSFYAFIDRPDVQAQLDQLSRTARRQNLDLEQLNALQDNLRNLNQDAVLLYPLILDDRLELILVTPYSPPIRRTVAVGRAELNRAIATMRQEIATPIQSNFPAAQQLYQWLIAPLEADLEAANAKTIIYAPDGQLRYIPLAALRQGDRWLIERFRINNITAASLTDFGTEPQPRLSVLAGAFSDRNETFQVQVGQRQIVFAGLPYAGLEVELIADEVLETTPLFNEEFSRAQVLPRMNDHSVVHFATHAEFVPGTPEDSFILFGDGDRATLRDVATWSLQNVDLVVLSACQTGVGGELGDGEEILGFGYQLQRTGARASLASLWSVDDGGTQYLMNLFYGILDNSATSKAEALRQAQLAMISGSPPPNTTATDISNLARANYHHPYYWSSFILIGNGL